MSRVTRVTLMDSHESQSRDSVRSLSGSNFDNTQLLHHQFITRLIEELLRCDARALCGKLVQQYSSGGGWHTRDLSGKLGVICLGSWE